MSFLKKSWALLLLFSLTFSCVSPEEGNSTDETVTDASKNDAPKGECTPSTEAEWNKLIAAQSAEIKNNAKWYKSLDAHMADEKHPCFGKTKGECLRINAKYQLTKIQNYCQPDKNVKEACIPVTKAEFGPLLNKAKEDIKNNEGWYKSLDKHMATEKHPCFGKTKEECLTINAEHLLFNNKNYCKPSNSALVDHPKNGPCGPTTAAEWPKLVSLASEEIKGNAKWYKSLETHMKAPEHPCFGKTKEECLRINAEHFLVSGKNYCKPK
ncbi:MAG: hypothetical protein GY810_17155 [Aureispira sp.]|nr:hypothetical protein [Aureispira sp.]